ncbi:carboxylesterase family protein [Streptomyces sp. NPDC020875]|uniref:carboxylesterase/lipase family protein n=1 Tax=Streptomyces sp. NPDC020875 TaxID=3154898 RepID=UPI0033EAAE9E
MAIPRGVRAAATGAVLTALLAACATTPGAPRTGSATGAGGDAGAVIGPVIRTDAGTVRGHADGEVLRYRGIPYAAPPVGDRRWAPPERPAPWTGIREAAKSGAACAQDPAGFFAVADSSEDCLYLDIAAPRTGRSGKKPVMVWIHGGGLQTGSGSQYDLAPLVTGGDVIGITINYRLGALGFLNDPALGPGADNLGLRDQTAALDWVRRNAAAFGGDPENVTVFGESAGAFSTCALVASPATEGLIDRAIVQSGPCSGYFPAGTSAPGVERHGLYVPQEEARPADRAAIEAAGCGTADDVLSCLRATDVKTWLTGPHATALARPVHGGTAAFLPEDPAKAAREGRTADIPMILGTTHDEWTMFTAMQAAKAPFDRTYFHTLLDTAYGPDRDRITAVYPVGTGPYARAVLWGRITADQGFTCPSLADARAMDTHGRSRAYAYLFADPNQPGADGTAFGAPPGFPSTATHGADLTALFGDPAHTPAQRRLTARMITYWTTFAHTGDPNTPGLPTWPPATTNGTTLLPLTPTPDGLAPAGPEEVENTHHCALFASLDGR